MAVETEKMAACDHRQSGPRRLKRLYEGCEACLPIPGQEELSLMIKKRRQEMMLALRPLSIRVD